MANKNDVMSMVEICDEALKHIDPVIKEWPQSSSTNDFHQVTLLIKTKLLAANYEVETINAVIERIFAKIAKEVLTQIAEENKIEEKAVKVKELMGELAKTFDKIRDSDIGKIRRTKELLNELRPLLADEINIRAANQKIEEELRRIVQKV